MIVWFILVSLKYSFDRIFYKKYKGLLPYKLALKRQKIKRGKGKCIWLHATSFGETLSTKTLVQKLRRQDPNATIIFSTFTYAGNKLAKTFKEVDQVIVLPLDFKYIMRDLVKSIDPDLFILIESDFWLNMLSEIKKRNIPMILVSGRMSYRSFRRYSIAYRFSKYLFSHFDYLLLQDAAMKEKFISLGFSYDKIDVIGNLKLDNIANLKDKPLPLNPNKRHITLGSTHRGEEEPLLRALEKLPEDITFILAPRKTDRFDEVRDILNRMKISWRYIDDEPGDERVVFVNKLGILEQCYTQSILAIVGGSFTPTVGGHNVYEPVRLNTPVIYGPNTYNQRSLVKIVEHYKVGTATTYEELYYEVQNWIRKGRLDDELVQKMKRENEGASDKAINLINLLLKNQKVCYT